MREGYEPKALWFGRTRAGSFGMLHEPKVASRRGVIFCNTLGFDGLVAHRAFRHLATDLTDRGFWTLRFDYDGEGDSLGGPWEPDRLAAWLASVDAAVGMMRSRGVSDIRLVGFRAGALLANLYATSHPGISGVVLWWPCVSGAAYVRELRALSRLSTAARPVQRVTADRFPEDSLEVCGFEFGAQALADVAAIDPVGATHRVVPQAVLLIDRADASPSEALLDTLERSGSLVDYEQMAGFAEFMIDDGVKSVLPAPILRRIVDWLGAAGTSASRDDSLVALEPGVLETRSLTIDDPAAGRYAPPGVGADSIVEEPVWVNGRLFAVVSRPAGGTSIRRVSIVLCTTGANNRIGPGRLYVNLARYWAALGFTVIRVDLGGVGDSIGADPGTENQPHAPIRIDELIETVAWIRRETGFDDIALFGLCSGAFNAFHAAIGGVEVNNVILVNPGVFYLGADQNASTSAEARLGAAHALTRGLMTPRKWRLAFREQGFRIGLERARVLLREGATDGFGFLVRSSLRNAARRIGLRVEAPSALPRDLETITKRGVKVLMVFAAGETAAHYVRMIAGPALDSLLRGGRLEIIDIDGGDHVFSSPGARQRLFEETTQYLQREYPQLEERPVATIGERGRSESA